jgi:hypothetical protein
MSASNDVVTALDVALRVAAALDGDLGRAGSIGPMV